jgi:parallel beta-helix repeat protein
VAKRVADGCTATMGSTNVSLICPSSSTFYVNASIVGGDGSGSSWTNANPSLSEALVVAHLCSNIKTIKVAAGTYKPSNKPFNSGTQLVTTDNRDKTFHIPDGVAIEGGYSSTGVRNTTTNETTLSGDIDNNNIFDNANAYHVVLASASNSSGQGVKIDGFTITGGNANGSGTITVDGSSFNKQYGAGIYTFFGSNTITNNTIHRNSATTVGGGIATFASSSFGGFGTIANNTIYNNSAYIGGGIYTIFISNTITNNTIYKNSAGSSSGGAHIAAGFNTITNNIFWQNKKGTDANVAGADYGGSNSTFKNNLMQLASSNYTSANTNALGTDASNNIFAADPLLISETLGAIDLRLQACSPVINKGLNSAVSGMTKDIEQATRIQNTTVDLGAYESSYTPLPAIQIYNVTSTGTTVNLSSTESGTSYQLKRDGIDQDAAKPGTGSALSWTVQVTGVYTVVGTKSNCMSTMSGSIPIAVCSSGNTLYVNASAGGTGDGSTWANAYTNLSNALVTAFNCSSVNTIKVAAGTYKPTKKPFNSGIEMTTTNDRDLTFHIPDGVTIEGGYNASTGTRDIIANVTTLSGDIDNNNKLDNGNVYHVVLTSTASSNTTSKIKIDGFSITGGNANILGIMNVNGNNIYSIYGGGIFTFNGTNTLTNNTIYSNSASGSGGGIYTNFSTNTLTNNTIYSNSASESGGGIQIYAGTNTVTNNTIYSNSADSGKGGGISTYSGTNTLSNNTLYSNSARELGGGIYTSDGTNTLTNNIFWQNKKGTNAGVASADYYAIGTNGNTFKNNLLQLASSNYPDICYGFLCDWLGSKRQYS